MYIQQLDTHRRLSAKPTTRESQKKEIKAGNADKTVRALLRFLKRKKEREKERLKKERTNSASISWKKEGSLLIKVEIKDETIFEITNGSSKFCRRKMILSELPPPPPSSPPPPPRYEPPRYKPVQNPLQNFISPELIIGILRYTSWQTEFDKESKAESKLTV